MMAYSNEHNILWFAVQMTLVVAGISLLNRAKTIKSSLSNIPKAERLLIYMREKWVFGIVVAGLLILSLVYVQHTNLPTEHTFVFGLWGDD